jgi:CBS domain-containing protein
MAKPARVPVAEIMSKAPVTVSPEERIDRVASIMRAKGIGSVVVTAADRPVGILTERDIVGKVAAENRVASSILVKDIMSAPLVFVSPDTEVVDAASRMAERGIRRLPVVLGDRLVGIVTENDILHIWPSLIEVTREQARAGLLDEDRRLQGHCENCGLQSTDLGFDRGRWLCTDCRGMERL